MKTNIHRSCNLPQTLLLLQTAVALRGTVWMSLHWNSLCYLSAQSKVQGYCIKYKWASCKEEHVVFIFDVVSKCKEGDHFRSICFLFVKVSSGGRVFDCLTCRFKQQKNSDSLRLSSRFALCSIFNDRITSVDVQLFLLWLCGLAAVLLPPCELG